MTDNHSSAAPPRDRPVEDDLPERFSIVAGGGFHSLLGRMGLLDDNLPNARLRYVNLIQHSLAFFFENNLLAFHR